MICRTFIGHAKGSPVGALEPGPRREQLVSNKPNSGPPERAFGPIRVAESSTPRPETCPRGPHAVATGPRGPLVATSSRGFFDRSRIVGATHGDARERIARRGLRLWLGRAGTPRRWWLVRPSIRDSRRLLDLVAGSSSEAWGSSRGGTNGGPTWWGESPVLCELRSKKCPEVHAAWHP